MITRGANYKEVEINIVGSSVFGRYPKISEEKTLNMFESDNFLVNYSGYQVGLNYQQLGGNMHSVGRGCFASIKLGCMIIVIDNRVYRATMNFDQINLKPINVQVILLGTLDSSTGVVYFAENNKPQICISDGVSLYIYDPTSNPVLVSVSTSFVPGYITFHDTYFLCAAKADPYMGPTVTNTWRLSAQNNGLSWPDTSQTIGLLQTKSDNTQAVVRFPSKGNMIFVMGSNVTEAWYDTGAQLFPYQRANQINIDYGCLNAATVAYMDEIVVWLASNEHSGPIIMYSEGGAPKAISTDGMDYLFGTLQSPQDSQGFLFRQDGHLIYHINFYTDNQSFFYDFNLHKFYNASDQNLNYFIAGSLCSYNQQYYFTSKNSGNLYILDTIYTTYQDTDLSNKTPPSLINNEIPRFRSCKNIRMSSQDWFIANDIGFTIETGETNYQTQYVTGTNNQLIYQNKNNIITQAGNFLYATNSLQTVTISSTPRVDLSLSRDGGASFGEDMPYVLNAIGGRRNKLIWWQCGAANDLVPLFKFWTIGRVAATNGVCNVRT